MKWDSGPAQRGTGTHACCSQLSKWSWAKVCHQTPPAETEQCFMSLWSGSNHPRHPKESQDMVCWPGWCLGARLPSPGQKQKDSCKSRTQIALEKNFPSFQGEMWIWWSRRIEVFVLCTHQCGTLTAYKQTRCSTIDRLKSSSKNFLQNVSRRQDTMNKNSLFISLCSLCCHTWSDTAFSLWLLLDPLVQGVHVPCATQCHIMPCQPMPHHPGASTALENSAAESTSEAQSLLCRANNWSSSDGCTIFNNHLVIIIMQKRDTAVNRCNCCIYPWYALTVQSLSVIRFTRIHLRWFVATEKNGKRDWL